MKITIEDIENYLSNRYSGWANETGMFMKLVEEIGEVAEILNMRAGRKAAEDQDLHEELGTELADIIHYTIAIAAINNIDLTDIILKKDQKASIKYNHNINLEQFILAHNK